MSNASGKSLSAAFNLPLSWIEQRVAEAGASIAQLVQSSHHERALDRVLRVTLLALVVRRREDEDAAFVDRLKATRWRVPVAEVVLAGGAGE